MTGQEIIDYIKENHLENHIVTVTATLYYDGDHDCRTTDEVAIGTYNIRDDETGKRIETLDFYVNSNLY